jgi:hypothetical protein
MEREISQKTNSGTTKEHTAGLLRSSKKWVRNAVTIGTLMAINSFFVPQRASPAEAAGMTREASEEAEVLNRYNIRSGKTVEPLVSKNWAGYIATVNQPIISGVKAEWTVPEIRKGKEGAGLVQWVGIGSAKSGDQMQLVTEEIIDKGNASYYAAIDLQPDYVVKLVGFPLKPLDQVEAKILLFPGTNNKWLLQITNLTQKIEIQRVHTYDSSRLWGEFIGVEATQLNHSSYQELADFKEISIRNCVVTIDNKPITINMLPNTAVVMVDRKSHLRYTPVRMRTDTTSFTIVPTAFSDGDLGTN